MPELCLQWEKLEPHLKSQLTQPNQVVSIQYHMCLINEVFLIILLILVRFVRKLALLFFTDKGSGIFGNAVG